MDSIYKKLIAESKFDYSLCASLNLHQGGKVWDTGNDEWYRKFNLRPQYYFLDGDNGKLSIYFKKCRDTVIQDEAKRLTQREIQSEKDSVLAALGVDRSVGGNIGILNALISISAKCDYSSRLVGSMVNTCMRNTIKVDGLTKEKFLAYTSGENIGSMLSFYDSVKLFSTSDSVISINESDGLYNLNKRLDSALRDIFSSCVSEVELRWLYLAVKRVGSFPEGEAYRVLKTKLPKLVIATASSESACDVFVDIILSLSGYTRGDILTYMSRKVR